MTSVLTLDLADVDIYADALRVTAEAIVEGDVREARRGIEAIAFQRWEGRLRLTPKTRPTPAGEERLARDVSNRLRAQVFVRDHMTCTYCGGRCVPRNVLVAFSDLFPEELPYHPNYRHGETHPMYWALAPEADHTVAFARGGSNDIANLTTLHTMCNARKTDALVSDLPQVELPARVEGWDGLVASYPRIIAMGDSQGRRHSAADYHARWLRYFSQAVL